MLRTSIIIRTKNEAQFLPQVLQSLTEQTIKDFEVIVVDDNSIDKTLAIAESFQTRLNLKIIHLPAGRFTYPHACNVGAAAASAPIIGYLSGHSVPVFDDYVEKGLTHFADATVAGAYGPVLPLANASFWERVYYTAGKGTKWAKKSIENVSPRVRTKPRVGLLGNTNSLVRRELWQTRPFNEAMTNGGEDTEWAIYWQHHGKKIIFEPKLAVCHSHGVGFWRLIKENLVWYQLYKQAVKSVDRQTS